MPAALLPDVLLFAAIVVVLLLDLFLSDKLRDRLLLSLAALLLLAIGIVELGTGAGALGNYEVRGWTIPLRSLFSLCGFLSLVLARPAFMHGAGRQRLEEPGVFAILLMTSVLGMHVLSASSELITFFLGLEMATLPLYALSTWHRDSRGSEAGIKYLLIGGLSTALFLFGCSFLYGASGHLQFDMIAAMSARDNGLMPLGLLFILCALAFKLSIAPFHMWAPDVYAGAPTAVTAFIASASKAAGILALVLLLLGPCQVMLERLDQALILLAVISMVVGNLGAIKQVSFNRFMAYSSIAQIGFILMALSGDFAQLALPTTVYYLLVYALSNYAAFFVMHCLSDKRPESIPALRGLSQQSPILAICMTIAMFSLAGIPPLAGFLGKLPLFFAAAEDAHYALILFAALNAVVALYYYMLIVKEMYITKPEGELSAISVLPSQRWILLLLVLGIFMLGVCSVVHDWVFMLV